MLLLKKSDGLIRSRYRTCLVHLENFTKFKSFFPTLILEIRNTKMDKIWTQGSPQHKEYEKPSGQFLGLIVMSH
jgi:hypothetical protein